MPPNQEAEKQPLLPVPEPYNIRVTDWRSHQTYLGKDLERYINSETVLREKKAGATPKEDIPELSVPLRFYIPSAPDLQPSEEPQIPLMLRQLPIAGDYVVEFRKLVQDPRSGGRKTEAYQTFIPNMTDPRFKDVFTADDIAAYDEVLRMFEPESLENIDKQMSQDQLATEQLSDPWFYRDVHVLRREDFTTDENGMPIPIPVVEQAVADLQKLYLSKLLVKKNRQKILDPKPGPIDLGAARQERDERDASKLLLGAAYITDDLLDQYMTLKHPELKSTEELSDRMVQMFANYLQLSPSALACLSILEPGRRADLLLSDNGMELETKLSQAANDLLPDLNKAAKDRYHDYRFLLQVVDQVSKKDVLQDHDRDVMKMVGKLVLGEDDQVHNYQWLKDTFKYLSNLDHADSLLFYWMDPSARLSYLKTPLTGSRNRILLHEKIYNQVLTQSDQTKRHDLVNLLRWRKAPVAEQVKEWNSTVAS